MSARAIWQGKLIVPKHEVPVKLYSAVLDRQVHFHLLHKRDRTRLEQRMVDARTGRPVPLDQAQKAFEVETGLFIAVTADDIERTVPEASREVEISRFVPLRAIDPQLFERPYYLGPAQDSASDYHALTRALDGKKCAGIASWVMRGHSYVGALISQQGYLMLITLRHAGEVIPVNQLEPPPGRPLEAKEKEMAEKLIEALSGKFEPKAYHDEYQKRVQELIDAKRAGKTLKPRRLARRAPERSLADSLRASLKRVSASRAS
jgi:DNA end-binding protein Ku